MNEQTLTLTLAHGVYWLAINFVRKCGGCALRASGIGCAQKSGASGHDRLILCQHLHVRLNALISLPGKHNETCIDSAIRKLEGVK